MREKCDSSFVHMSLLLFFLLINCFTLPFITPKRCMDIDMCIPMHENNVQPNLKNLVSLVCSLMKADQLLSVVDRRKANTAIHNCTIDADKRNKTTWKQFILRSHNLINCVHIKVWWRLSSVNFGYFNDWRSNLSV